MEFVIVLGYGCRLTKSLESYLTEVAGFLAGYKTHHPHVVVIPSGGFTNRETAPDSCEALVIQEYLRANGHPDLKLWPECKAVTTLENLRFSRQIVEKACQEARISHNAVVDIVIFCDSIRAPKVRYLAKRVFLGFPVRVTGHDFKRGFREKLRQRFVAAPLEILSYRWPWLERRMVRRRLALNATR